MLLKRLEMILKDKYTSEIQDYEFEKTDDYLKRIVEKNPSISQMYLIDKEGMQFYKTSHLDTLGSRGDREYHQGEITGVLGASIELSLISDYNAVYNFEQL